jgi:hypothetical protein
MYLIRFRFLKLLATLMHLILSSNKVIALIYLFNSKKLLTNRIKNIVFLTISHAVMYSASVDNRATHYWRFKLYEMGELYIINIYLIINLLVTGSFSQLEFTYLCNPCSPFR